MIWGTWLIGTSKVGGWSIEFVARTRTRCQGPWREDPLQAFYHGPVAVPLHRWVQQTCSLYLLWHGSACHQCGTLMIAQLLSFISEAHGY